MQLEWGEADGGKSNLQTGYPGYSHLPTNCDFMILNIGL